MSSVRAMLHERVVLLRQVADEAGRPAPVGSIGRRVTGAGGLIELDGPRLVTTDAADIATVQVEQERPAPAGLGVAFCAVVGSRAHGLESPESDVDRRGFFLAGAAVQFSLDGPPDQIVHDGDQLCFWEAAKFVRLALKANPTVLESLFSPVVEFATPRAQALLDARDMFLSQRAYATFMGYADAQFEKMQRARDRGGAFKWQHAMHLIRLLQAGIDLVRAGRLEIEVGEPQRDELLAIKQGERSWEDVTRLRCALVEEFADAFRATPLPEQPDEAAAERWLIDTRLAAVRGGS
jgi:hypothetical protein